ncbi:MAG: chemotaxis protein CheW [Xanthomonadales bacterium]|jgi:chemosensory pili system protein ChpC|nr:chemotaxis protein CheW [Xanthomonadales bacterium]
MSNERKDIRGVTISVTGGRLLLPNANIAEIITFAEPEALPEAPNWVLGRLRWRGWRLPLVSFSRLAGLAQGEGELGAKVAVLRALGGHSRLPYFCLLTQGFPRLTTVSADALIPADEGELPAGALMRVLLRDEYSYIPDLIDIERRLVDVLQIAA